MMFGSTRNHCYNTTPRVLQPYFQWVRKQYIWTSNFKFWSPRRLLRLLQTLNYKLLVGLNCSVDAREVTIPGVPQVTIHPNHILTKLTILLSGRLSSLGHPGWPLAQSSLPDSPAWRGGQLFPNIWSAKWGQAHLLLPRTPAGVKAI